MGEMLEEPCFFDEPGKAQGDWAFRIPGESDGGVELAIAGDFVDVLVFYGGAMSASSMRNV